ncbi:MAG: dihydroorotate dehydrogenase [Spirochaetales bacterium]|nr:dihydroorotate dehydrogenase [Spirochaetales bacterium]
MDLTVTIGKRSLKNPVGLASGTFGYGGEYESLVDLSAVGALYTKTITPAPRAGNECPRIIETPSGLLNSIGLANVGVEVYIKEKLPALKDADCAIVANISGETEDGFGSVIGSLEECERIWGYEVNVSCPNVSRGGIAFGTDPGVVEHLTSRLRRITEKPLIVKLTPNVTDICAIARAAEAGGADAVSCINTVVGMVIDTEKKRPVLGSGTGGLSGPAIRPVGVAAVYRVKRAVSIPVIGLGGIMTGDDALQYLLAGAAAVQIGTATFVDPSAAIKVLQGIESYCRREGIKSIPELNALLE